MRVLPVVLCALLFACGAAAATFSYGLSSATSVTLPTVTLSGVDQPKTFTVSSGVSYTGTNNISGWKVQASAPAPASGSNKLPLLSVTAGTFSCVFSCTTNPTNAVTYPLTLGTTAQTIYNATANTGRGTFTVNNTVQLNYASNAFPGTYTSTVTLAGSVGP
jgi:hypothetical protein